MQATAPTWKPTDAQKAQIRRAYAAGPDTWLRAECAGDRVTLASLHYRGYMVRRVWRASATSPAHEYQLHPRVRASLDAAMAAKRAARA